MAVECRLFVYEPRSGQHAYLVAVGARIYEVHCKFE